MILMRATSVGDPRHLGADPYLCLMDPDPVSDPTLLH